MSMASRWLRPEVLVDFPLYRLFLFRSGIDLAPVIEYVFRCPQVYPLFAATGVAVGICGFSLIRNITGNPEVRFVSDID